jgi:hypothetical protein
MVATTRNVFLMSCGSDDFRFPYEWITAFVDRPVADTHIAKWWSSGSPSQGRTGDTAALVATKSGKVMGAFEVLADPIEDRSHPTRPGQVVVDSAPCARWCCSTARWRHDCATST